MKNKAKTILSLLAIIILIGVSFVIIGCSTPALSNGDTVYTYTPSSSPDGRSGAGNPPTASSSPYYCEGEFYSSSINGNRNYINYDFKPSASNGNTVHLGSCSGYYQTGIGDTVVYNINFTKSFNNATLQVKYADDAPSNGLSVYFDNAYIGSFTTVRTGGWGSFVWHPTVFNLGNISVGIHYVKICVTYGGNYGMNLDQFKITAN
jgi:hypothetical protein